MHVTAHHSLSALQTLAKAQERACLRLRFQMVILALQDQTASAIAVAVGCSERTVYNWLQRYNTQGLPGLDTGPRSGRPTSLLPEHTAAFAARLDAGPQPQDQLCTWYGADIQRLLDQEFGVHYSLSGVYHLLHRLGYSSLMPRPQHAKADPLAQAAFKKSCRHKSML